MQEGALLIVFLTTFHHVLCSESLCTDVKFACCYDSKDRFDDGTASRQVSFKIASGNFSLCLQCIDFSMLGHPLWPRLATEERLMRANVVTVHNLGEPGSSMHGGRNACND